jgi:tetratricopeptide (TPR) repeat protein
MTSFRIASGLCLVMATAMFASEKLLAAEVASAGTLVSPPGSQACMKSWETRVSDCLAKFAPSRQSSTRAQVLFDKAKIVAALLDYKQAKSFLDPAMRLGVPTVAALHFSSRLHLSIQPYSSDNLLRAERDIDAALKRAPLQADLWATKAIVSEYRQRKDQALVNLDKALSLDVNHTFALRKRAILLFQDARFEDAEKDLNRLIAVAPKDGFAYRKRADIRIGEGRLDEALPDLDKAILYSSPDPEKYFLRAWVHSALGNFEDALRDATAILEGPAPGVTFNPIPTTIVRAMMMRGMIHRDMGNQEAAVADIMNALPPAGKSTLLRVQVYLAGLGESVAIDGVLSEGLRKAVAACLNDDGCAENLANTVLYVPEHQRLR